VVDKRKDPKGGESDDQLRAFLVDVATDPAALGRFVKDPEATMSEAGLSADDQAVLRSGNPAAINARLAGGPAAGPSGPMMLVVDVAGEQVSVRPIGLPQFVQQFPQLVQQIAPQILPQVTPQILPQLVQQVAPQILPQVLPQIHPQQVHPQLVQLQVQPLVFPQIHPQQVHPQLVQLQVQPLVFPQIHPQQIHPMLLQQIFPNLVFPQLQPLVAPGPFGQ
jgi:hypothetical protein